MILDCEKEDRIISEFLRALGPWSEYVVIGGGYALIIYRLYLADQKLDTFPVGTHDIDSLIPRKVPQVSHKNLALHLQEAGFKRVYKDYERPATESYIKELQGSEIEIEFLTDSASRKDKLKNVSVSGIVAQPLSYLILGLETAIRFSTSLSKGLVVSPGAWMFHKGLTFTRRNSLLKMHKDLYGLWYAATQLGNLSGKAIEELHILSHRHPQWFKTFRMNLLNWLENAAPVDWTKLEAQDPYGRLRKLSFERAVMKLIQPSSL
jgi:hypothetical protein